MKKLPTLLRKQSLDTAQLATLMYRRSNNSPKAKQALSVRNSRPSRSVEALGTRAHSMVHSPKQQQSHSSVAFSSSSKDQVPAKVFEACDVITHKKHALNIRYRVRDQKEPLPNIIQIEETLKGREVEFWQRMQVEMNRRDTSGLGRMTNINSNNKNYLREVCSKIKRERNYLRQMREGKDGAISIARGLLGRAAACHGQ